MSMEYYSEMMGDNAFAIYKFPRKKIGWYDGEWHPNYSNGV